jgi:hypothetical protein
MSYILNNEIRFSDSPNIDAFGRLRTSEPYNIFNSTSVVTNGDIGYETLLIGTSSGTASMTYNQAKSEVQFNVTGNGQTIIREQHGYNHYQPGKSQLILLTGIFGATVSNTTKRMGYYNDLDGLFFQFGATGSFGVTKRTSTSGTAVDTFYPQTTWNIDTLINGNALNPSGYNLDLSKTNIFIINFQWLGVGRIVFALDLDGVIVPIHQILNGNLRTEVYMRTANLPVRYEVISTGGTDSSFKQICASVISEGGQEEFGYLHTVSNGLTVRTFTTRQAVLSVRLSPTFYNQINRVIGRPYNFELLTTTATVNAYWELILQRGFKGENNLGGSPTWIGLTASPFDYSVTGTTVATGTVIDSGFMKTSTAAGESVSNVVIDPKTFLSMNITGNTSDWLHLVVTPSVSSSWAGKITVTGEY